MLRPYRANTLIPMISSLLSMVAPQKGRRYEKWINSELPTWGRVKMLLTRLTAACLWVGWAYVLVDPPHLLR